MTTFALEQTAPVPGALRSNTEQLVELSVDALREGADVVVFPELAASGYVTAPEMVAATAQPLDGPLVGALTALTARRGGLVAAGYAESCDGDFYNSVVLVGADGPVLNYRKVHLFDTELDGFRLALGGRTPEETAVSIVAEIIALRNGGSGTQMRTVTAAGQA